MVPAKKKPVPEFNLALAPGLAPLVLEGEHVRLEPLGQEHAEDLLEAAADPAIWRYLPIAQPRTVESIRNWIAESGEGKPIANSIAFAIVHRPSGRAVGSTRYLDIQPPNRGLEIGWTWLGTAQQRSAVNTECKLLLLRHAFDGLGAVRVQLKTDSRNRQSQAAILRLGAKKEGTLRNHMILWDGHLRHSVYFSIVDSEWPAVKTRLEKALARKV